MPQTRKKNSLGWFYESFRQKQKKIWRFWCMENSIFWGKIVKIITKMSEKTLDVFIILQLKSTQPLSWISARPNKTSRFFAFEKSFLNFCLLCYFFLKTLRQFPNFFCIQLCKILFQEPKYADETQNSGCEELWIFFKLNSSRIKNNFGILPSFLKVIIVWFLKNNWKVEYKESLRMNNSWIICKDFFKTLTSKI